MKLNVNEVYGPVLQGEGASLGTPVFFLRLSGCNLHCSWCDTAQTWNFEGTNFTHNYAPKVKLENERTVHDAAALGKQLSVLMETARVSRLVISGGEPLIQQAGLVELLRNLKEGISAEIETNGTFVPDLDVNSLIAQYNVSPKLANSGNQAILRKQPRALEFFSNSLKSYFKYVVSTEADIEEVNAQVEKYGIPKQKVFLMPLGHDLETQTNSMREVEKLCLRYGYRLSPRLHVLLHGYQRGI